MESQQTDLQRTVEIVSNMTDKEKGEILKVIPTQYLFEEMERRIGFLEKLITDVKELVSKTE